MTEKGFTITTILLIAACILPIAVFNYWMDPMWTFGSNHKYNQVQTVINERQQKTNNLYFNKDDYDTLLIGSSRSTYINQNEFSNRKVYNYAVADLSFKDYDTMIEFAKTQKGMDLDTIIIGVDFFKTSIAETSAESDFNTYIDQVKEPFYRYKNLLSLDVLNYSRRNYNLSKAGDIVEPRNYNRSNVADALQIDSQQKEKDTVEKISKFRNEFYKDGKYEYNEEFKEMLETIQRNNPNTEFILFTTPIYTGLFDALLEEGRYPDYVRWLEDITEVFGEVHHFMYPNVVTNNMENYFDGHHFYPHVGAMIAHVINGERGVEEPDDFGVLIKKDELENRLNKLIENHD
ncbi:hypothetical protein ACFSFY_14885 [Sporosarcina siberiensis]|uniref:D-alanyl-lipoteichoic acid biosynthesis protein DltD n=1 Tax=Sporosarcina siberiensis TaxID=1365606 RepID=A0ABW4SJZ2_9BACL